MDEFGSSDFSDSYSDDAGDSSFETDDFPESVDFYELDSSDISGDSESSDEEIEYLDFDTDDTPEEITEDSNTAAEDIEYLDFDTDDTLEEIAEDSDTAAEDIEYLDFDTDDTLEEIAEDSDTAAEDIEYLDFDADDTPEESPEDSDTSAEDIEYLDFDTDDTPVDIAEDSDTAAEDIEYLDFDTNDTPVEITENNDTPAEDIEYLNFDTNDMPEEIAEDTDISDENSEEPEPEAEELPEEIEEDSEPSEEVVETLEEDGPSEEIIEDTDSTEEDTEEFPELPQTDDEETAAEEISEEPEDTNEFPELPQTDNEETAEEATETDDETGDETGPVLVLKKDEKTILDEGNQYINEQLADKALEYAESGLSESEITDKLAADKWQMQKEYLDEQFPGQDVSPHVFNGYSENGALDRIHELNSSPALQEILSDGSKDTSDIIDMQEGADTAPIDEAISKIENSDLSAGNKAELLKDIKNELLNSESEQISDIPDYESINSWIKDINPNYDPFDISSPYSNNCGSCAFAVEQHLSGNSDITATAKNIDTIQEMNQLTGMEQTPMGPDEIRDYLLSQGPGAHAIVGIDRAVGPGHWFNAVCLDDHTVVALDGQSGEVLDWPPDYGNVTNWDVSMKKGL